jgi:hypothetical protein
LIFDGRSRAAKVVRQALALLKSYPTTLAASRETMQALLAIESPIVTSVVANELHLTAPPDVQHPVADASLPATKAQWDEITAELERQAVFNENESHGAKQ